MIGAIGAAVIIINLPQIGNLDNLVTHEAVIDHRSLLPDFDNTETLLILFILPLAVQWWSVWYPGAEPGGGGYIVQRMLSAKDEKGAIGATLLFNVVHYALRPWPWILVALASLIVFPDIESMQKAFPKVDKSIVQHDFAYPAMLSYLPNGFLGLVVASLIAAFMSTISTQINWGSSYVVNDFYKRFLNTEASEKQLVLAGRLSTIGLMIITGVFALLLSDALQAFNILLQIGAGTGLLFILRWFWWRINAYSEFAAMIISFVIAIYLELIYPALYPELSTVTKLLLGVGITTVGWITVTFITRPTDRETLRKFYRLVHPGGPGWKKVINEAKKEGVSLEKKDAAWDVPVGIIGMILGVLAVYSALFATGNWLYGNYFLASFLTIVMALSTFFLIKTWTRLSGGALKVKHKNN